MNTQNLPGGAPVLAALRAKLVKVLGRLGSDHEGERAAAGLLASRMLATAGATWDDIITPDATPQAAAPRKARSQTSQAVDLAMLGPKDQRRLIAVLLRITALAADDRAFLTQIDAALYREPHAIPPLRDLRRLRQLWQQHAGPTGGAE